MPDDLVIIGAGGFGRETLDVVEAINAAAREPVWRVTGVVDDHPSPLHLERLAARGYTHLGSMTTREATAPVAYVIGVGSTAARVRLAQSAELIGWSAATLVHPSASVGSAVVIEAGAVVCGGVQVSTNVHLGKHVHLNPGSIVGHDSRLGDHVSVNPGAIISGEVVVADEVLIGAGAVVLQGLTVGRASTVGAGACVTHSVSAHTTVVGVPARPIVVKGSS